MIECGDTVVTATAGSTCSFEFSSINLNAVDITCSGTGTVTIFDPGVCSHVPNQPGSGDATVTCAPVTVILDAHVCGGNNQVGAGFTCN